MSQPPPSVGMAPRETLQFLAASAHRPALIERLSAGPARPADLVAALGCSRASVHRHLSALSERGWVEKVDGEYRLTETGRYVNGVYERCVTALACVDRFEPLLAALPSFEPTLSPELLADGELTVADPDAPHGPLDRYVTWLSGRATTTDRVRCVCPVLSEVFNDAHERALEAGVETELLLPASLFERALDEDPEAVRADVGRSGFELRTLPDCPGFGLTVADSAVFLGAYDGNGRMQAGFESETREVRSWALDVYDRLRSRAEPVPVAEAAVAGDD